MSAASRSFINSSTATNRPTKKAKLTDDKEEGGGIPPLPMLLHRKDIWISNILPFLGLGHYIFVASVCEDLKEFYEEYYSTIEEDKLPRVGRKLSAYSLTICGKRKCQLQDTFFRAAFSSLSCAKYWHKNSPQNNTTTNYDNSVEDFVCSLIARHGNVQTLDWAHRCCHFPWNEHTCSEAARSGSLKKLQYAHNNGCPSDGFICADAVRGGSVDVLQFSRENIRPWDTRTCVVAAQQNRLDILGFAHANGCPWDAVTCEAAATTGNLKMLQYAHENACPWDKRTCEAAARSSNVKTLQYAHENGCPWDEETCWAAAMNGCLHTLRYAHENGCPWDRYTCHAAAEAGNLKVLQYAHENGCPWDSEICCDAALYGHLEVLRYAYENGCPWSKEEWDEIRHWDDEPGDAGHDVHILQYLRQNNLIE